MLISFQAICRRIKSTAKPIHGLKNEKTVQLKIGGFKTDFNVKLSQIKIQESEIKFNFEE